ncbi:ABC transporter ATP-binding protein [Microbacterium sp. ASV49]|uniref:ABC transporter ATP-binding protein n=1 Tax=Microbacterium candidum TaxID=3041922 RepID=A0ABT7N1N1_9MICO|nr:ABC transporter ATP-binding protein [Microbacterium sp. ASV49]MDL9980576.1 ABC transporter ATP-binding protein [Microbacterium sp. ASV49]
MTAPLLDVRDLRVTFPTDDGLVHAVNGMDLQVRRGETVGIVGESGSGKTVTSQTLMGLLKETNARITGSIEFDGVDLVPLTETQMRPYRGRKIGMIFQDPLSAMHPFDKVGVQIAEAYRVHNSTSKKDARNHAIEMLRRVGIPDPVARYDNYPHEFSGGMRQRAMIAMALICEPELLIADEPTTALDVTVQAQILDLIASLQAETGSAVIFITHDLGVVAEVCERVVVMYGGQAIEEGDVRDIFFRTEHPYTKGLMASMPSMTDDAGRLTPIPGFPPSLIDLPHGCMFAERCPVAHLIQDGRCFTDRPALRVVGDGHRARCHLSGDEGRALVSLQGSMEVAS